MEELKHDIALLLLHYQNKGVKITGLLTISYTTNTGLYLMNVKVLDGNPDISITDLR